MSLHVDDKGRKNRAAPALVLMHFLGGSGREWDEVVAQLGRGYRTVRWICRGLAGVCGRGRLHRERDGGCGSWRAVSSRGSKRYVLVGHSMSGKVAMVLARRAADAGDKRLRRAGAGGAFAAGAGADGRKTNAA